MSEEKPTVICKPMHNEEISKDYCNLIRHAKFCGACAGNKDGRTVSVHQAKRDQENKKTGDR